MKAPQVPIDRAFRAMTVAGNQDRVWIMPGDCDAASWADVPRTFRVSNEPLPAPWQEIFGPLRQGIRDDLVVVGQFGQSIDARLATPTGHSHYINGAAGLAHLHR